MAQVDGKERPGEKGRYLPLTLDGHHCHALVDSGNLWKDVISDKFAKVLGLGPKQLRPATQHRVGTAKDGAELQVMGEVRTPIAMRIAQTGQLFRFRPAVIKGLSMDVNISQGWLAQHKWDHYHSTGHLRIGGQDVRLVPHETAEARPAVAAAYTTGETHLGAHQVATLWVHVPDAARGHVAVREGVFAVDHSLFRNAGAAQQPGFVRLDQEGCCRIRVMNNSGRKVTIPAGKRAGTVSAAKVITDSAEIAKLCAVSAARDKPATKEEKKTMYFQPSGPKGREGEEESEGRHA